MPKYETLLRVGLCGTALVEALYAGRDHRDSASVGS